MQKSSSTADREEMGKEYLVECEWSQVTCGSVEEAVQRAFKALRRWCRSRTECKYQITDVAGNPVTPKRALLVLEKEPHLLICASGASGASGAFLGEVAHIWEKKWYEEDHARSMKGLAGIMKCLGSNAIATFPKVKELK